MARILSGARCAAVMLLLTLLTTATAWAQTSMGFSIDPDIPEGEVGHYYLNMPTTGSATVNIPVGVQSFMVYDDGGKDGNYSNNCDGSITLIAPEGCKLQMSGNLMSKKGDDRDRLIIYDGAYCENVYVSTANYVDFYPLFWYEHTHTSEGRSVTIRFESGGSDTYIGFGLKVMVVDESRPCSINIANAEHGSITSSKSSAAFGEPVTLTVTPDNGYLPSEFNVQDAAGNPVTYMGWYSNTSTFDMPGTDVIVTPTFTNKWTAEGGLYINMPDMKDGEEQTIHATIPAGVKSFKIYDPGGKEGKDYYNMYEGSITLIAPEGCKLQLTGSIMTYNSLEYGCREYLNVSGWGDIKSSESGIPNAISTLTSSGREMTLRLFSLARYVDDARLDLTVTVIYPTLTISAPTGEAIIMPEDEKVTVDISVGVQTFKVYDPGGEAGNDYGSCSEDLVLNAPEGCKLQVSGTFTGYGFEHGYDYLRVYDDNGQRQWLLGNGSHSGETQDIGTIVSCGRNLTISFFSSKNDDSDARLNLTVMVIDESKPHNINIANATGGSITASPTSAMCGDPVTLTVTPDDGYLLNNLVVVDAADNPLTYMGWYSNTSTITMPVTDVTVTPTFTTAKTAEDGLYINMPDFIPDEDETIYATIPAGVQSFKIYDPGGKEGKDYSNGCWSTLVLTAPEGCKLQLTGFIKTYSSHADNSNDRLNVDAPAGGLIRSHYSGIPNTIYPLTSDGQEMTLQLVSTGRGSDDARLDLTVTVIYPTYTISAPTGEAVTMFVRETKTVEIPVGVKSFKVYDPGGEAGNDYGGGGSCYSDLVLIAPEGCRLRLSGSIKTYLSHDEGSNDYLSVDGGGLIRSRYSGIPYTISPYTSSGREMTLEFHSSGKGSDDARLDLTVAVLDDDNSPHSITIANTAGNTVTSDKTSASLNETVTLTAAYAAGYLLNELDVRDVGNVPISVTDMLWYTDNNTATFEMPVIDVTVTPTFLDTWTAEGGLCINMPSGVTNTTIPVGVQSFKVYDNGGKDGSYSRGGQLNLTAPEGCQIQLSGSITLGAEHYFSVWGGDILINEATSTSDGIETDLPTVTSNGRIMRLFFDVHGPSYDYAGLDLTVKIIYTNSPYALTAPTGESVDMPTNGTKTIMISEGVESFKVYDDGGADGKYAKDCDGYLTLTTPEGCRLQLSGRLRTYDSNDYLTVYDGTGLTTTILGPVGGSNGHNYIDIGTVTSSGQGMTLYFRSDDISTVDAGLDLTVTVINASDPIEPTDPTEPTVPSGSYTVSFNGNGGRGSMAKQSFTMNEAQYLPANTFTRTGYMFTGWNTAADGSGSSYIDGLNVINLTTTPGATVTLYAQWAYDVTINNTGNSVNMPKTGSGLVPVSEGVESFKVYDDGGASNDYSDLCDGYLTLIAPKGCVLQLSGSITSVDSNDYLTVYDGSDNTTTILGPVSGSEGIGTVTSSGRSITLYFHSDRGTHYAGLDLTVTVMVSYELTDDTDFDVDALAANNNDLNGKPAIFTRSFATGVASTICLPFPMTGIEGGKVYEFVDVTYDNSDGWVATMTDATPDGNKMASTEANKPYLFMPTTTGNVTFRGTIPSDAASYDAGTTTRGDWIFRGTYTRLRYGTAPFDDPVFGFAATTTAAGAGGNENQDAVEAGEFVRAIDGASIRAFRAFLKYSGSDALLQARGTRGGVADMPESITVRLIGKGGEIDGIGEIRLSTGEVTFDPNAWYDLNGRKLDGKPTVKGIYINGGHKVAIK